MQTNTDSMASRDPQTDTDRLRDRQTNRQRDYVVTERSDIAVVVLVLTVHQMHCPLTSSVAVLHNHSHTHCLRSFTHLLAQF